MVFTQVKNFKELGRNKLGNCCSKNYVVKFKIIGNRIIKPNVYVHVSYIPIQENSLRFNYGLQSAIQNENKKNRGSRGEK